MKVLILSCSMGQGHNAAGKAVYERLRQRGVDCEFADALRFASEKVSRKVEKTYVFITTHAPNVFGCIYRAGNAISSDKRKSPVYLANKLYQDAMGDYIEQNHFDVVVMPHLFPAQTLTSLKNKGRLHARTVAIATDYTCIPFWEETDMDSYIIPHRDLAGEFIEKGIPAEKLLPYGIPVRGAFAQRQEQAAARARLGIVPGRPAYLIMTGSMGFGNAGALIEAALASYGAEVELIALVGTNRRMKEQLAAQFGTCSNVHIVEFTDDVSLYMDACDLMFTKPGGLTSTEAAVKNIPLVHTDPIPGCETQNAQFFSSRGMSIAAKGAREQLEAACRLQGDAAQRDAMLEAQRANANPDACDHICDLITGSM